MTALSRDDVKSIYSGQMHYDEAGVHFATLAIEQLWAERCEERQSPYTGDRSSSCKFAALLARELFGGRLAGNLDHVFVILEDGTTVDLNHEQEDVAELGQMAYAEHSHVLLHAEYREALGSCLPRVQRWVDWAIREREHWESEHASASAKKSHCMRM